MAQDFYTRDKHVATFPPSHVSTASLYRTVPSIMRLDKEAGIRLPITVKKSP